LDINNHADWTFYIPFKHAINTCKQNTIRVSPYEVVYGRKAPYPVETIKKKKVKSESKYDRDRGHVESGNIIMNMIWF
jgi:hypothetical protein